MPGMSSPFITGIRVIRGRRYIWMNQPVEKTGRRLTNQKVAVVIAPSWENSPMRDLPVWAREALSFLSTTLLWWWGSQLACSGLTSVVEGGACPLETGVCSGHGVYWATFRFQRLSSFLLAWLAARLDLGTEPDRTVSRLVTVTLPFPFFVWYRLGELLRQKVKRWDRRRPPIQEWCGGGKRNKAGSQGFFEEKKQQPPSRHDGHTSSSKTVVLCGRGPRERLAQ